MECKNLLLLAIGFYTRLPCPQTLDHKFLPQAAVFLPVIGWLVGGFSALCFYLACFIWSESVAIILSLIAGILITGAFHEDGFADVCDGFGGGWDKQQILDIMKDPRIGTYGVLGLILILSLKISLLMSITVDSVPLILLAGHSISRLTPLLLMQNYDYARSDTSKSSIAISKPGVKNIVISAGLALFPFWFLPIKSLLTLIPLFMTNWLLGQYFYRRINGYTGDCLGASQQIAESVFYLSYAAL